MSVRTTGGITEKTLRNSYWNFLRKPWRNSLRQCCGNFQCWTYLWEIPPEKIPELLNIGEVWWSNFWGNFLTNPKKTINKKSCKNFFNNRGIILKKKSKGDFLEKCIINFLEEYLEKFLKKSLQDFLNKFLEEFPKKHWISGGKNFKNGWNLWRKH